MQRLDKLSSFLARVDQRCSLTGSLGQGSALRLPGENARMAPFPLSPPPQLSPGRHGLALIIRGGRNRSLNVLNISKALLDKAVKSLQLRPLNAAHRQQEPLQLIKIGRGSCDNDLCLPNSF